MNTPHEIRLKGFALPEQTGSYVHLPFEVPPGTGRLEVRYAYDEAIGAEPQFSGGNTVDIGIFDPRGAFNAEGFRGWSGSDRAEFFLAATSATPGYLPGPLQPGAWHICLGLYKLSPNGCHYEVTIRLLPGAPDDQSATFPPLLTVDRAASPPRTRADGWYHGELHCHTQHSDGDSMPRDLIAHAQSLGLDFLAITDHNVLSHLADQASQFPEGLILIPGYEVTTYRGHWNIWGGAGWIDFRIETPDQMERGISQAAEHDYLTSCNHPCHFGCEWRFEQVRGYQCVEVWNGPWRLFNHEAAAFWETRLRAGERLVAVGGSDCHRLHDPFIQIGTPTTWIHCPGTPSAAGLLAGLQAGHAFISDAPDGPQLYLGSGNAMMGDVLDHPTSNELAIQVRVVNGRGLSLEILGAGGCLASRTLTTDDETLNLSLLVSGTSYLRAQLVAPDETPLVVKALTNPLYLR